MQAGNGSASRARWEVVYIKGGRLHRIGTGSDFSEALRLYTLAVQSGDRANVTLRCANMGFPPPDKLQPRVEKFDPPRRKRGSRELVYEARVVPMARLNREGVWWCPFCIKLRRFKYRKGWWTQERVWVADQQMVCPVCKIDHNNFEVRYWNPKASQLFYSQTVVDPDKPLRRRRRRRRKPDGEEE